MPEGHEQGLRGVRISGVGLACAAGVAAAGVGPAGPGKVPGFKARLWVDRKQLKLMTRAVQLGVATVRMALDADAARGEAEVPPLRRGLYVGASPQPGDPDELRHALAAAEVDGAFDLQAFAARGYPLIHPLWLLRGLSNNVLGFSSATHDLQGVNANYCDGPEGGWTALSEGAAAIAEGRADLVVAGGADCLLGAEALFGGEPCGEGAAFLVLRPDPEGRGPGLPARGEVTGVRSELGHLGAAEGPVAVARQVLRQAPGLADFTRS